MAVILHTVNIILESGLFYWRLFLVLVIGWVSPAVAIVNMEDVHLGVPEQGFSGQFRLSGNGASGNTEKYDVSAGTRLQWYRDKTTDFIMLDYSYGRASGTTHTDKGFFHLRHVYQMNPELAWEGFGQVERNEFTRLEFRGLVGSGARFTIGERASVRSQYLGSGVFYVSETLAETPGLTDDGTERLWRANIYYVIKYRFNEQVKFLSSTYYQPAFREASDYRMLETASLLVGLARRLDLTLGFEIVHDSQPPQSIESTDVTYRTGISYQF